MRLSRMCSIFTIAMHVGDGRETSEEKVRSIGSGS